MRQLIFALVVIGVGSLIQGLYPDVVWSKEMMILGKGIVVTLWFWIMVYEWASKPDVSNSNPEQVSDISEKQKIPYVLKYVYVFFNWYGEWMSLWVKVFIVCVWKITESEENKLIHLEWKIYNAFSIFTAILFTLWIVL